MENHILDKHSFLYYYTFMNMEDNRIIIVALQEVFMRLQSGAILLRSERKQLEPMLVKIIKSNTDSRVRRWAYMVGSFCFNPELVKVSIERLSSESDLENRTWIVALLAFNLPEEEFNKLIYKMDHGLTEENIRLAIYLFCDNSKFKISRTDVPAIMDRNNKISLFWLGSIAAYSELANRRKKEPIVTNDILSDLTNHEDDEVLKHVMYAYSFKSDFSVEEDFKFDYYDFMRMAPHHKKWFLTTVMTDTKFIKNNPEFVEAILDPKHLFNYCDKRIREGLARGLTRCPYVERFAYRIAEWATIETEASVNHFLMQYIVKWKDRCDDFMEIVNDELLCGDNVTKSMIYKYSGGKEFLSGLEEKERITMDSERQICVLVVTANKIETEAVLNDKAFIHEEKTSNDPHDPMFYNVGSYGCYQVVHFQLLGEGSVGSDSSELAIVSAINSFHPDAVILVGVAFGKEFSDSLNPSQKIGDVLISDQVGDYESGKIKDGVLQSDGPKAESGRKLLSAFKYFSRTWKCEVDGLLAKAEFGLIVSGDKVVDDRVFKGKLLEQYPRMIGGEMEGRGAYNACRNRDMNEWIIVKGICDWADGTKSEDKEERQMIAAKTAVSLISHVFAQKSALAKL